MAPTVVARRIIVVSRDGAFGRQLEAALLTVAAAVDVFPSLDWIDPNGPGGPSRLGEPPALCAIYLDDELARAPIELAPRLPDCPVIAVLPRSSLAAAVELMQSARGVAGVMTAEDLDPQKLAAMAARIVTDDLFGLEKVMPPGTEIHAQTVGDFQDKARWMETVAQLVEQGGVPRRYHAPVEQCLDEMLMNALYDAPVDAHGKHIFAGVPAKTRIAYRTEQTVAVQYACDGKQLAIAVRDAFGSLDRLTVLRYLHKCLYAKQQVDRKAGGAGLGLYLMVNSSTAVYFNVLPGIATEAICIFDLEAPKPQLAQLGFFVQRDAAGRAPAGPARRLRAVPRRGAWAIAAIAVAAAVLAGGLVLSRGPDGAEKARVTFTTIPKGAAIELAGRTLGIATEGSLTVEDLEIGRDYPVVARLDRYEPKEAVVRPRAGANEVRLELQALATVELETQPTGAAVEIDGKPAGSTPLTLTSLPPGATISIVFKRTGYRTATARLEVPAKGDLKRLVQPLEASDELVRVHFVSNPPGAEVTRTGEASTIDRTYTPADVFVEAGQVQRFTLTMPRHVPLVLEPFTPRRGETGLEKGGDLIPGATLRIEATLDGKVTVSGAPHCRELALPAECMLAPGTYAVEYLGPSTAKIARTVTMEGRDATEKLELGFIQAAEGKRLQPGGLEKAIFEAGTHTIIVSDETGNHRATVSVKPGATVIAR